MSRKFEATEHPRWLPQIDYDSARQVFTIYQIDTRNRQIPRHINRFQPGNAPGEELDIGERIAKLMIEGLSGSDADGQARGEYRQRIIAEGDRLYEEALNRLTKKE